MKIRLFKTLLTLAILFVGISQAEAQTKDQPSWLNAYFGHQEFDGDLGNEMLEFNVGADWAGGIGISQYLHRYLDLELAIIYGQLDYKNFGDPISPLKRLTQFEKYFINVNTLLKFRPLRNPYPVQPYIGTGFGITRVWGSLYRITSISPRELQELPTSNKTAFQIPLQLGADIRITDNIYATANATYNRTFSDGIDGRGGEFDIDGTDHDDFMVYSVGIKFGINKTKDADGDGIKDKDDLCPNKYGTSFWGCPDSDGDGIEDNNDACPEVAGRSELDGCPDSDGDGIINSKDRCPNRAGSFENEGCPNDTDGDGLLDDEDACPERPGNRANNGCPEDADGDGIINSEDDCPQEAGVAENNGCPKPEPKQLEETVQRDLENIIQSLQFRVSSSNIDPSSYDELTRLAQIMQEDTELRLIIRGHTDNTGNSNANLELSIDRANAVKDFLVKQGVDADRIAAFGYGETRPIASNDTPEGREQNRRVELDLYYPQ
ncbi:OmpA family protein [Balneolaceae bacterium YR4-1]|uniref:OmpA family protein n=1 Tax=Halalkalibaculum roseum TaxID=2709311 RepID=A0A6M1T0W6_9BACT|nr:OmpA family protein [Halalkalibaculum roseum]NGP77736.1 OmpA family protein [Halalkalibaculum roseum]